MEPKDKTSNEQEQDTDSELIGVQEQLNLHSEVIHDMLPFMPPEVQAKVQAKLGEQKRIESDGAIHAKVDAVHSDVLETKSLLGELKSTIDTLSGVVANLAVKTPPSNPPENKDKKEEPKEDKKQSDEKKPDEKDTEKDKTPPASPQVDVKDAPVYLHIRKRGGRIVRRLAKQPQKAGA